MSDNFERRVINFYHFFFNSKGDMKNAAKFLEMFVSVAESAGLQDSLADACSAVGTMYNTMVREKKSARRLILLYFVG